MNIAIDFGTCFTYVGTWVNGQFMPLIHGDANIEKFGYPTTLQTVGRDGPISDYQCEISDDQGRVVRIECFGGAGLQNIKKSILKNFQDGMSIRDPFDDVNDERFWTANHNGVGATIEMVLRAFFEVLLKLTYKAVQEKVQAHQLQDSTLNRVMLCFPILEDCTNYHNCLRDSFIKACREVGGEVGDWAKKISRENIFIEAENKCVPALICGIDKYKDKSIMFIDIGGSTCDTCIKTAGQIDNTNPGHFTESMLRGTSNLDTAIKTLFIDAPHAKFRNLLTPLELADFKAKMEEFGIAQLDTEDSDAKKDDDSPFPRTVTRTEYDSLNVWQNTFGDAFMNLKHTVRTAGVDYVVLSGGGSKITNIVKMAKEVFGKDRVKTIESIAEEIDEKNVITANNGVCYGAAVLAYLEGAVDDRDRTNPGVAEKASGYLVSVREGVGAATINYDIRYGCRRRGVNGCWEEGYHLFIKANTHLKKPLYSNCDGFTYGGSEEDARADDNTEVWTIHHLKEISIFSEESFLPKTEVNEQNCADLKLIEHKGGVRINNNTSIDIGVIACQGTSSLYFIVATYAGKQIECGGKIYKKGDLIDEAWFSVNPIDEKLHAPSTKDAYEYAKTNRISPDCADSEYKESLKTPDKTPTKTPEAVTKTGITDEDKREAESKLKTKYNSRFNQVSWIHILRKKKLKNAYSLYESKICRCSKKEELEDLLNEAQEEFDRI